MLLCLDAIAAHLSPGKMKILIVNEAREITTKTREVYTKCISYGRVVQTCGSGTKFGSLGQNFLYTFCIELFLVPI